MKARISRSRVLLYSTLVFALLVGTLYRLANPPAHHDPLRGDDDDSKIALQALLQKTPTEQQEALLRKYVNDSSPNLRLNALETLEAQYPQTSTDLVQNALADSSAPIREWGLESAQKLDRPSAIRLFMAGIQDTDTSVKMTALQELKAFLKRSTEVADKSMVPLLMQELQTSSPLLRASFIHILIPLTGKQWALATTAPLPTQEERLAKWKTWWKTVEATWTKEPYSTTTAQLPTRSDPAPDFSLNDVDGKPFHLAQQKGRVVMVNFWGTWCGPCKIEIPDLQRLSQTLRDKPFDLIGLALNEEGEERGLKERSSKLGVTYRQALCPPQVQHAYGEVTGVPITYLMDKRGNIRYRWEGPRDYATFYSAVEHLLKE